MRIWHLLFFLTFCTIQTRAQELAALGDWKAYLPYRFAIHVTQSADKIYYATDNSLLVLDKADRSSQRFSKVDGLSAVNLDRVQYQAGTSTLMVIYDDAAFDLVREEGITTIRDITNFRGILGEKKVLHTYVESDSTVLISGNYGISRFNLNRDIFTFTTFTDQEVWASAILDNFLYIATDDGLYRSILNNPRIEDFGTWTFVGAQFGFPDLYRSRVVQNYNDALYMEVDRVLYRWTENKLDSIVGPAGLTPKYLTAEGARLVAGFNCRADNCGGATYIIDADGNFDQGGFGCVDRPLYAVEDADGVVWYADQFSDFRNYRGGAGAPCERLTFNSPKTNNVRDIALVDNDIWVATGGYTNNFNYLFRADGVFGRVDGDWRLYGLNERDELNERTNGAGVFDISSVVTHPSNGNIYAGSFMEGLVEITPDDQITVFNETNAPFGFADPGRTRVGGLAFDDDENLWITNHLAEVPLHVRTPTGEFRSFRPPGSERELVQIVVDQEGYKWIATGSSSSGFIIFDEGELDDTSDDRWRIVSESNSNLPSNRVKSLAVDQRGSVWVGTEKGAIVFNCGQSAFDPEFCAGFLPIGQSDDINAYLLETENIQTIAVDGANRKWFGTSNGIFVISPDGDEELAFFNEDNSPLFANNVLDIAIRPSDGEVFIGSEGGLQSFRGQATEGGIINKSKLTIYPNPVRPEYEGDIAIRGLATNADFKITDVSGQLVFEGRALGGQAIWNGRDYNGRRVNTGVYLVLVTNVNRLTDPDAVVGKILFIN